MQIGDPVRTIVVEPLELPVNQPTGEPEPAAGQNANRSRYQRLNDDSRLHLASYCISGLALG